MKASVRFQMHLLLGSPIRQSWTGLDGAPYGVEVPCESFGCWDDFIYSTAEHGDEAGNYDGGVYIKRAENSKLLQTYRSGYPANKDWLHLLFVDLNECFETIGDHPPTFREFLSKEAAYGFEPPWPV